MKSYGLKKRIAAMMTVSVLAIWFALPNVANAKTVTVEGRNIYTSLTGNLSSVTASITYTEGSGSVGASVTGYACEIGHPENVTVVSANRGPNATPGGASANVSAPSGYKFYTSNASYSYTLTIGSATYSGNISDSLDL